MITPFVSRSTDVWLGYHKAHLHSQDHTRIEPHDCAVWFGRGVSVLGLPPGAAHLDHANRIFRNVHPLTGAPLRSKPSEVALFECTYSAPKSVSLLTIFDDRLPQALMQAAHSGLRVLERNVATRERKGALHRTNAVTPTNNLTALCVPNFSNRAGEPQAHVHAGIANLTLDELDVEWTAIETSWLFPYENRSLLEATCHSELAWHLRAFGYDVVRIGRGFEVDGIAPETLDKVSTRRAEVLETAAKIRDERELLESLQARTDRQQSRLVRLRRLDDRGIRNLAARESRSAKTEPSFAELATDLRQRLTAKELDTIAHVVDRARNRLSESVPSTSRFITAAKRILSREFVTTSTSLRTQVLSENPGIIRSAPDGTGLNGDALINLRGGFVADPLEWERIGAAIHTLVALRGTIPALASATVASAQTDWISKVLSARSPWMLLDECSVPLDNVIKALNAAGISVGSAAHGAVQNHVVVLSSADLLPFLRGDTAPSSRVLIVRDARGDPVEALLCRKLVENGAAIVVSAAPPEPKLTPTAPSTFMDEACTIFLNAPTRRGRFAQFVAGNVREAATFTERVRAEVHRNSADTGITVGDTVRATGNNRIGAKRTYRSWLYSISARGEDGSLVATNGLSFPPSFKHLEFGFAVSSPELVAPNTDMVVVSPTVNGAALKKLQAARPELRVVQMMFRNRPRNRRRRAHRRQWQPHLNLCMQRNVSRGPDLSVTLQQTVIEHPVEQPIPTFENVLF